MRLIYIHVKRPIHEYAKIYLVAHHRLYHFSGTPFISLSASAWRKGFYFLTPHATWFYRQRYHAADFLSELLCAYSSILLQKEVYPLHRVGGAGILHHYLVAIFCYRAQSIYIQSSCQAGDTTGSTGFIVCWRDTASYISIRCRYTVLDSVACKKPTISHRDGP